jgi:hypothetical protein
MRRYLLMLLIALLSVPLAACGAAPVDRCLEAKNPLECQQVVKAGGNAQDYLLYGMAGYMLSSVVNGGQRQTVIVADPSYRGYRRPISSYQSSHVPLGQRAHTVTTTTTRRSGDAVSTTVRTKSWSSGSSYRTSSVSYRPSFRSGR